MRLRGVRRRGCAPASLVSRSVCVLAVAVLAVTAAGCSVLPTDGRSSLASAAPSGPVSESTLAFESIDGPPPDVFRKLVANLNDEAGTRQIAVVSRTAPATYRIRGYVSALVERNKTTFAWVWDVYDTEKRRTLRIAGEEPAVASHRRDAWAAADDKVLRHMARDGMERIAAFLNSAAPTTATEPSLATLVSRRDDTPEAAGIFRVFRIQDRPAESAAVEAAPEQPLPPKAAKPRAKAHPDNQASAQTKKQADGRAKDQTAPVRQEASLAGTTDR
jgi:hypothetical protein